MAASTHYSVCLYTQSICPHDSHATGLCMASLMCCSGALKTNGKPRWERLDSWTPGTWNLCNSTHRMCRFILLKLWRQSRFCMSLRGKFLSTASRQELRLPPRGVVTVARCGITERNEGSLKNSLCVQAGDFRSITVLCGGSYPIAEKTLNNLLKSQLIIVHLNGSCSVWSFQQTFRMCMCTCGEQNIPQRMKN